MPLHDELSQHASGVGSTGTRYSCSMVSLFDLPPMHAWSEPRNYREHQYMRYIRGGRVQDLTSLPPSPLLDVRCFEHRPGVS